MEKLRQTFYFCYFLYNKVDTCLHLKASMFFFPVTRVLFPHDSINPSNLPAVITVNFFPANSIRILNPLLTRKELSTRLIPFSQRTLTICICIIPPPSFLLDRRYYLSNKLNLIQRADSLSRLFIPFCRVSQWVIDDSTPEQRATPAAAPRVKHVHYDGFFYRNKVFHGWIKRVGTSSEGRREIR